MRSSIVSRCGQRIDIVAILRRLSWRPHTLALLEHRRVELPTTRQHPPRRPSAARGTGQQEASRDNALTSLSYSAMTRDLGQQKYDLAGSGPVSHTLPTAATRQMYSAKGSQQDEEASRHGRIGYRRLSPLLNTACTLQSSPRHLVFAVGFLTSPSSFFMDIFPCP